MSPLYFDQGCVALFFGPEADVKWQFKQCLERLRTREPFYGYIQKPNPQPWLIEKHEGSAIIISTAQHPTNPESNQITRVRAYKTSAIVIGNEMRNDMRPSATRTGQQYVVFDSHTVSNVITITRTA